MSLHLTHAESILKETLGSGIAKFEMKFSYGEKKSVRISKADGSPVFVVENNPETGHGLWIPVDSDSEELLKAISKARISDYDVSND